MQRRSQTVRHHAKPSLALISDDLGVLREGDESNEDVLRRQLLDRDRECDKLRNQVQDMEQDLKSRPTLEQVQALQREYKDIELLLQGTQRENERFMTDLERVKARCRMLERKLTEVAGENWQTTLEVAPAMDSSAATIGRAYLHSRSNTLSSSPLSNNQAGTSEPPTAASQQQLAAHIEQVRMLVLGMEKRIEAREEKLGKHIDKAENEGRRFEEMRQEIMADA